MSSVTVSSPGHDPASGAVRVGHDCADISPSLAVVEAIADLADVDPVDLADETGIVLYEHVDPDALDALVADRPAGVDVDISFSVDDYRVSVGDTSVVVRRSAE